MKLYFIYHFYKIHTISIIFIYLYQICKDPVYLYGYEGHEEVCKNLICGMIILLTIKFDENI